MADGTLRLLDQRLLPQEEVWLEHESAAEVAKAIRDMVVRSGARPSASAPPTASSLAPARAWRRAATGAALEEDFRLLADLATHGGQPVLGAEPHARPSGANERGRPAAGGAGSRGDLIHESDREANPTMAQLGMERSASSRAARAEHPHPLQYRRPGDRRFGTALGAIRAAHRKAWVNRIYADETRPWLQARD